MIELYDFQKEYLKDIPAKFIFAADTGTGKSYMALEHYRRHSEGLPLLILAPASKIRTGDWQRDIKEYLGDIEYEIYSYERFSRNTTANRWKATGERNEWGAYLKKHGNGFAVIADEVHRAKNPQSGIGRAVFGVARQARGFAGLSATPLPNGWVDAANYFKIFGYVKNKTEFYSKYVNQVNYKGFPEITGYKDEYHLSEYWNAIAKPLIKSQALDLPDMTFVPVRLEQGKDYNKIYKERLVGDKFLDNPSALAHALRKSLIAPKIDWLNEFLEGVSDNVVIFYNYVEEREAIRAMIKKLHKGRTMFRQDGVKHEVPNKDQWSVLKRTITLAQYQSGSTGIELTYAATTIYFSPTYSYSNYEQSIGRTNRNGQTQKMTFYLLCAPTTIERNVWDALRDKTDFQSKQWVKELV